MARTYIKICGIKDRATLDAAIGAGADFVGFVHFEKSPRHLAVPEILELIAEVPTGREPVILLVDPPFDLVRRFAGMQRQPIIQLHGKETPATVGQLRSALPLRYWKALAAAVPGDLSAARRYAEAVERVLFDAKPPADSMLPGGNGVRIDWDILRGYRAESLPWGLAGGLDPDNVAEAIRVTSAPLVDVSSGVECAPGVKDVDKIAAFCKAVAAS